ncbi:PmoA family protein [Horticoccus luteus]|uniref:PmoA family protein n=1 Tax=Horticoccus luteus TaxID=2862869 RepID=A0A8F9TU15_9BACT|nr:DUF6807 family protein [Horticoccus luteus]QYM79259.1 PmoA family protein [Horticoccus luteus]
MKSLRLHHEAGRAVAVALAGEAGAPEALLCRYVYASAEAANESPRPYFHPLNSLAGDTLTNFRPNDHPWHHGLSLTVNHAGTANFWGGPTCLRPDGYQWRDDHGAQHHLEWSTLAAEGATATLAHTLAWRRSGETIFTERREIVLALDAAGHAWSLHWRSALRNATTRDLALGNPSSAGGLAGSHYTGLQFRGARALLDDHLDKTIEIIAEGGLTGEKAVHGAKAGWMEWHAQSDTTLHRVKIRFTNNSGPLQWFVRRGYPLAAFPFQADQDYVLAPGATLSLDHTLTFTQS